VKRLASPFAKLDRRDRRLLTICLCLVGCMVVVVGIFAPAKSGDDPVPSTYGTGNHGAKAAYLTLGRLGYSVERWTDPLAKLSDRADEHTTLILAEPHVDDPEAERAQVTTILERGGRVLAAGGSSALILPHHSVMPFLASIAEECKATAAGFDSESSADSVRMRKTAYWGDSLPSDRTEYDCEGKPVVVAYREGKGQVIWWADTLPLENRGITMDNNLELLLRSVGPASGNHIYWDESLHGEAPSIWSYASGTPVHLALLQVLLAASLLLLSYSRRSGPLRTDPVVSRASPVEFVRSLGGLFHKAHSTNAAVDIANQHLRRQLQIQFGISSTLSAADAVRAVERRMPVSEAALVPGLRSAMVEAENAASREPMKEGKALTLVQALEQHEQRLGYAWKPNPARGK
jgi:hypothetical protein